MNEVPRLTESLQYDINSRYVFVATETQRFWKCWWQFSHYMRLSLWIVRISHIDPVVNELTFLSISPVVTITGGYVCCKLLMVCIKCGKCGPIQSTLLSKLIIPSSQQWCLLWWYIWLIVIPVLIWTWNDGLAEMLCCVLRTWSILLVVKNDFKSMKACEVSVDLNYQMTRICTKQQQVPEHVNTKKTTIDYVIMLIQYQLV